MRTLFDLKLKNSQFNELMKRDEDREQKIRIASIKVVLLHQ
jgi:hypothetical protein